MQIEMHLVGLHKPAMDYKQASVAFLRRVVEETKKSPTELARMVGKSPTTFTRPLASPDWRFAIKFDTLNDLSDRTGIPLPPELLKDRAEEGQGAKRVTLPIRYEVAAGAFLVRDDLPQQPYGFREVPSLPGFESYPQWLERVVSDSMDRLVVPGSLVHVVDAVALRYKPREGHLVVVERERGQGALVERTVKQIHLGDNGVELWPRSHNPRWQSPLRLAEGAENFDDLTATVVGRVLRSFQEWEA